ncbi:MAG: hypothetical protein GX107_06835 [Clostridiales bacterium]|jgi:hypothetical protein|nr:hypothetical protein [Clostridiales bacterium]
MKKALAIILAAATALLCLGVTVYADEPALSPSGFYVGQVLEVGYSFSSFFDAEMCVVTYTVGVDEVENVTSGLGKKFAPDLPITQFRDSIPSFVSQYGGIYTVKGYGEEVKNMMDNKGEFVASTDLKTGSKDDEVIITIDYKYNETTLYKYMSISGWTVVKINKDNSYDLDITLEPVWSKREPTKLEAFGETLYTQYLVVRDILRDIFGNVMLEALPKFFANLAQFFKSISKV